MYKHLIVVAGLSGTALAQPATPPSPASTPTPTTPATPARTATPATPATPTTPAPPASPAMPAPAAEQPPAAESPATAPTPAPAAPAGDAAVSATAEPPKKLAVGKVGLFNPGMLAQAWVQTERAGGTTQVMQFRLRRAEMSVNGEIIPKRVAYRIMFDPAKVRETTKVTVAGPPDAMGNPTTVTINNPSSAVSVLQDFYITALTPYADVSVGQFKIPVSWEGYNSSGKLLFPERAVVSSAFGDKRDLGLRIEKKFAKVGYSAGVFNGSGLDSFETNLQKDVALRLEAYPIKGLTIAGVTYDSVGQRDRAGTKDRWELDVRYESGPMLFQAEALVARDVAMDGADATPGRGFYALAGYTLSDVDNTFHGDLQPVFRIGAFDPNTDVDDNALLHFDLGVNYYLVKHEAKLQLAYQRTQFQDPMKSANNQVIFAAQVNY